MISFDVDGTLLDRKFADSVWLEEIPRVYSVEHGIPLEEANRFIKREYDAVGDQRLEWYDLNYWLSRFKLSVEPMRLFEACTSFVKPYPEVPHVLQRLREKGFRLVVITNAPREFACYQLKYSSIENFFERIFSSFTDFGQIKKTKSLFERVLCELNVSPDRVVHVGDHPDFDFRIPRELGIKAFYLDRSGRTRGEYVLHDLGELAERLK